MQQAKTAKEVISILADNPGLPWETIPSDFLKDADVWGQLLPTLPLHATLRNLGRMSANGLLTPLSAASKLVVQKLSNTEQLRKSRVHPIAVLMAQMTYQSGHGLKGSLSWTPVKPVVAALEDAFYGAFANVEPSNKNVLLALDVSGSMCGGMVAGVQGLTPNIASAAMALVTARTEPNYHIFGFATQFRELPITSKTTLKEAMRITQHYSFGGTDCSLPIKYAQQRRMDVDGFVVYTDSETWAGNIHPTQALTKYRKERGLESRNVVVGMVSNGFSIADPDDRLQMDVVGLDANAPQLISQFIAGDF